MPLSASEKKLNGPVSANCDSLDEARRSPAILAVCLHCRETVINGIGNAVSGPGP